jgi:hypothetical protein
MSWSKINKPTGATYTRVNILSKEEYDQSDISYDSSVTYYDGGNENEWAKLSKPSDDTWDTMNMTWDEANITWDDVVEQWNKITKPI